MEPVIIRPGDITKRWSELEEKPRLRDREVLFVSHIMTVLLVLWGLFDVLSVRSLNAPSLLLDVVGFLALMIVPGSLVGLRVGWAKKPDFTEISYVIGTSLLVLMVVPLIGNVLLPYFGIAHPLDRASLLLMFNLFVFLATCLAWKKSHKSIHINKLKLHLAWRDYFVLGIGMIIVTLSVLGAIYLNNGGSAIYPLIALTSCVAVILMLIRWNKRLREFTFPSTLFLLGLSLLLMTSLRGWYTTGHDINLETRVFELTKTAGIWKFSNYKGAYNACLSITILPTVLANLLKQTDPYVFKVYFQIIFAICPALIYSNMRRYVKPVPALLSSVYFIAYPTFFTDMPYINRQEIAFVFLGLMILSLLDNRYSLRYRRTLMVVFGMGMILSHYSTTYATIAILLIAYALRPGVMLAMNLVKRFFVRAKNRKEADFESRPVALITIPMLIILISVSLFWNTILTDTSTGLSTTIRATISALKDGSSENSRSNDANDLIYGQVNIAQSQLDQYIGQTATPYRDSSPSSYYPASTYSHLSLAPINEYASPLTKAGNFFTNHNVNISSVIGNLKALSPKLIALFAFTGMGYVIFRRKRFKHLPPELITLAAASLAFVAMQIVLPELSIQYGLPRAYQQALFALSIFLVIGSYTVFSKLPFRVLKYGIPTLMVVLYFISNTGLITAITGGYDPSINLANNGSYYDIYYPHSTDIAAEDWISNLLNGNANNTEQKPVVQAEEYSILNMQSTNTSLNMTEGLYPGMILKNSYVFLNYTNVTKQQSSIFYDGNLITYNLPLKFFDNNKNLIYSNGSARIYR